MPLPSVTVDLAVSIATGVIKLVRRLDDLAAENAASQNPLALVNYFAGTTYNAALVRVQFEEFEQSTRAAPGADDSLPPAVRQQINDAISGTPTLRRRTLEDYAPERLRICLVGDGDPVVIRRAQMQLNRADVDLQRALHFVGPGLNERADRLPWRVAMVLLDTTAEFVVAEQERIFKSADRRKVVAAVLVKFSEGDLEDVAGTPGLLFRRVLSSTLNGFLDTREAWDGDNPWLDAVLTALTDARDGSPAKDDFLLGLVEGHGYRRLIKELAEEGASALRDDDSTNFKDVLADLIEHTGTLYSATDPGGRRFLQQHWADIARAGLKSFSTHGPQILDSQNALLKQSLVAAAEAMANSEGRELLSADTVVAATEAAIAAVAAEIVDLDASPNWPKVLVSSFADVIENAGLRATFTGDGLDKIVRSALHGVARNPELLAGDSEFGKTVVGSILGKIAETDAVNADALGSAVIEGALLAIADRPDLVAGASYAEVLGDFAKGVAELVGTRQLSGLQGEQILRVAAESVAANPGLLSNLETKLASKVVSMVVDIAGADEHRILVGGALSQLVSSILDALSQRGEKLLGESNDVADLVGTLRQVITKALARAGSQIGTRVNLPTAAEAVDLLFMAWSRGEITEDLLQDEAFADLFDGIADSIGAARTVAVPGG